jgi:hypothetical protein
MPSHMPRPWVAGRGVPTADYFSCVLFLHYVNVYMFQEYLSTVIIYIYNALGGCGTPCSHRDLGTCRFWHRRFVLHTDVLFTAYIQRCVFRAVAAWQNAWGKRNYHVSIPSVLVLLIPFPSKAIHNPYPKHANYSYLGLCDAWARSESQYHKGSWLMTAYSPKKSNITAGICLPQSPLGTPNDRHLLCQRGVASDWARGNATGFYSSVHRFYWIKTALLWTMYTIPWIAPILIYIYE